MTKKIVKTDDGSSTFFNEKYQQCYHSQVGAYTEALEKHVKPSQVLDFAQDDLALGKFKRIQILDVCFGLGYNSGVAIEKILETAPDSFIEVFALENDIEILKKIPEIEIPESYQNVFNEISKLATVEELIDAVEAITSDRMEQTIVVENLRVEKNKQGFFNIILKSQNFQITILLGDARERVLELQDRYFDAVFFDPFSPKECPELWAAEFVSNVVSKSKLDSYISTYSSARIVKDNFAKAGCEIHEGPKLSRRSGGVLAKVI